MTPERLCFPVISTKFCSLMKRIKSIYKLIGSFIVIVGLVVGYFDKEIRQSSYPISSEYGVTVTYVFDGDTIEVCQIPSTKSKKRVRLFGIDAPEFKQEGGQESKNALEKLLKNKKVRLVQRADSDSYGRFVAEVFVEGENDSVNLAMLRAGRAWHYNYFAPANEFPQFHQAEEKARRQRLGLWKNDNPVPPWEWRRLHSLNQQVSQGTTLNLSGSFVVKHVIDGDTLELVPLGNSKSQLRIQLFGIDAPEYRQAGGKDCKQFLTNLVKGKQVRLEQRAEADVYGRLIAELYIEGERESVNITMLRAGKAWHYDYYAPASQYPSYRQVADEARKHRFGIWKDANPMPPWEWRRQHSRRQ